MNEEARQKAGTKMKPGCGRCLYSSPVPYTIPDMASFVHCGLEDCNEFESNRCDRFAPRRRGEAYTEKELREMRTFLGLCRVTGYLMDEQIDMLQDAVTALSILQAGLSTD